ncbi:IclR family transcriptional regulator [Mesorhizobium sp. L-8-3]|nr:IclR family transcriptional regulator [Mesorhizobium sp. L-8-3]
MREAMDGEKTPTEQGVVKSATRALDLLEYIGRWGAEKTHSEIAEELGIPKSSLTQLLKTLVNRGYLAYVPATKGYELGTAVARLARHAKGGSEVIPAAESVLEWVTLQTQESCALNVMRGMSSQVVACVTSPRRLLYHMRLGDTAPLYATSGGKALLAFLPDEMLKEYLARVTFEPITLATIRTVKALIDELEVVRQSGVAYVVEEFTPGIAGVARPLLDESGFPLASINIAIPMPRFNDAVRDHCVEVLGEAVATVSRRLAG